MKRRHGGRIRILALALTLTILLAQPLPAWAAPAESAPEPASSSWENPFGFLSYKYKSGENYFYNVRHAFQWIFGFNRVYDALSPLAGCLYDTIRCEFEYGGRKWMVQLWKGAYMYGLCTGGEIGIYKRTLGANYGATKKDFIGMEFSIYHNADRLFTRKMQETWWATGFQLHILGRMRQKPRGNCTMDATLVFQNAEMASLFAKALAEKGFTGDKGLTFSHYDTERYSLNGKTVRLLWRNITEGYY